MATLSQRIKSLVQTIGADIKAIKTKVDGFKSDENGFLKTATSNLMPPNVVVNSLKVGDTSPKVAFEVITIPITLNLFKYNADGTYQGPHYQSGNIPLSPRASIKSTDILSTSARVYCKLYSTAEYIPQKRNYGSQYYELIESSQGYLLQIKSTFHATDKFTADKSGQAFFDKESYVELFVIYKVA